MRRTECTAKDHGPVVAAQQLTISKTHKIMTNETKKPQTTEADRNNTAGRNKTGEQPATKREGAENTQGTAAQQPGTHRQGAENAQGGRTGNDSQPGTQRKGAENTQMGKEHKPDAERGTSAVDTDARGTLGRKPNPDPLASDDASDVETDTDLDEVDSEEISPADDNTKANTTSGARK